MNNSVSTTTGKTKIKIVLLGNQGVGKSCIIEKYVKDNFDETANPTVGIDFLVKNVSYHNKNYRIQLWDTAGQERFRSLIPNYLKDAKCALIIFDVTSKASLNSAESWLKLYNDNRTCEGFTFLIGNKIDLEYREVEQQEGRKKAEELGLPYYEISAKTGQNIEQLFHKLIDVSQKNSVNAVNFDLSKKQSEVIKQQQNAKEDDMDVKQTKSKSNQECSQAADGKPQNQEQTQSQNVVLRNQKIQKKEPGNKGCC